MRSTLRFCSFIFTCTIFLMSCSTSSKKNIYESGTASWYGEKFHGRTTASGEIYNMNALTAAHKTLPFGTKVLVRSTTSGHTVIVTINDRGPFISGRIIDLSKAAAKKMKMIAKGEDEVELLLVSE